MSHTQCAESIVILPLDQEILIGAVSDRKTLVEIPRHEIVVYGTIRLNRLGVALPDETEPRFIPLAEQRNELIFC